MFTPSHIAYLSPAYNLTESSMICQGLFGRTVTRPVVAFRAEHLCAALRARAFPKALRDIPDCARLAMLGCAFPPIFLLNFALATVRNLSVWKLRGFPGPSAIANF